MCNCESCPRLVQCDKESMKRLELINDIEKGMNNAFSQLAYDSANLLRKKLEENHLLITGRTI